MNELQKSLLETIKKAGDDAMKFYGNVEGVDKGRDAPVTEADLLSEKVIFAGLEGFGYPFLSEESEDDLGRLESDRVWIVDPLDGTKDFIQKTGDFSIMVALVEKGRPILGAVYAPARGRLFYAIAGEGAFEEGALQVSDCEDFKKSRMLISRNHLLELEQKLAESLGISDLIPCGSAGLKSALIAAEEAEIYLNTSDKTFEWDICAADLIVTEAGGKITDMKGERIEYNKRNPRNQEGFVVSNGLLHEDLIDYLRGF